MNLFSRLPTAPWLSAYGKYNRRYGIGGEG